MSKVIELDKLAAAELEAAGVEVLESPSDVGRALRAAVGRR